MGRGSVDDGMTMMTGATATAAAIRALKEEELGARETVTGRHSGIDSASD